MPTHDQGRNTTKSVSFSDDLYAMAEERAKRLGFDKFSKYIQQLVKEDLEKRPEFVIKERVIRERGPAPDVSKEFSSQKSSAPVRRHPRSEPHPKP